MTTILERTGDLALLDGAIAEAAHGRSSFVLIAGEAGIGKSSLVDALHGRVGDAARVLTGFCDDLSTPRTLGPVRDLARSVGSPALSAALEEADREAVFEAVLAELAHPLRVSVLVVEDVHWADDATLDLLRYLARRLSTARGVVVLTYRDDEVLPGHPLERLLGGLAGAPVHRLSPHRLSRSAIEALADGRDVDIDHILEVTGGNPFFVRELLAAGGDAVPTTVVDAVQSRLRTVTPAARAALEQLAVLPAAVDHALARALVDISCLPELEQRGFALVTTESIAFSHELLRRAVEDAVPVSRRLELHRRALAALVDSDDPDPARIVHHARAADDRGRLVAFAPAAAREAARAGAHRQALAHYETALGVLDAFDAAERADLLEGHAMEAYVVGRTRDVLASQQQAVELRRRLGDDRALGNALLWLSRFLWWANDRPASEAALDEAIAILEAAGGPSAELAMAYSRLAQLHMLAYEDDRAVAEAERAAAMAREVGDDRVLAHALCNLGTSVWRQGDQKGQTLLHDSQRLARSIGAHEDACRAYTTEIWQLMSEHRHDAARLVLSTALALAEDTEQLGFVGYLRATLATSLLATGEYDQAEEEARRVLQAPDTEGIATLPALAAVAGVLTRRGDPAARTVLEEAWEASARSGELQRIAPVAALLAEHAWLSDDSDLAVERVRMAYELATRLDFGPFVASLGYWLGELGQPVAPAGTGLWRLHLDGEWRAAEEGWREAGQPYERALALVDAGHTDQMLEALAILDALGAEPAADLVRRRLRERGAKGVPRGPQTATRSNPAGLTPRQLEVLGLIAEGRTNAEIAARLVLSVRTVDHHVSAVLQKLGVSSRQEAAAAAAELLATS